MVVLVTGANGFVGSSLIDTLKNQGLTVRAVVRSASSKAELMDSVLVSEINSETDWSEISHGVDVVIHLAARVHMMKETSREPLAEFNRVNVDGSLNLAGQAARAGVKRFIFISSIKVNGEYTEDSPFAADSKVSPADPYAISKWQAEIGLRQIAKETGMEVVIIRPPLIYGPGVKANFLTLLRLLNQGIPLPFGAIHNKRSLVALDNLVGLIVTCIRHPNAANQTFLVSDNEDVSTTSLLRRTAIALRRPARLLPVPMFMLKSASVLLGKGEIYQRLCGSLQIDIEKTKLLLDWSPTIKMDEALIKTADDFLMKNRNNIK